MFGGHGCRPDAGRKTRDRVHFRLAFRSMSVSFADSDAALVFDANRFDDTHLGIRRRAIDLRQVLVSNLPARLRECRWEIPA